MIELQNALGLLKPDDYLPYTGSQILRYAAIFIAGLFLPTLVFGKVIAGQTWAMSKD